MIYLISRLKKLIDRKKFNFFFIFEIIMETLFHFISFFKIKKRRKIILSNTYVLELYNSHQLKFVNRGK